MVRRASGGGDAAVGLAVVVAGTVAYAVWLVPAGAHEPGWLVPAVHRRRSGGDGASLASRGRRTDALLAAALAAGLLAGVLAPAVASAELVAQPKGAFDTPFESASGRGGRRPPCSSIAGTGRRR